MNHKDAKPEQSNDKASSNDNVARKLPYEVYSVPVYSSDHLYPQSRSDVLDVVYDESDFQSNTIDYDKSDLLTSNFENETGSEFSKTKDVLNKIKNYRQQMKWRRV